MTLNEWIILGDVGISSKTMWAAITGTITETQSRWGNFKTPQDWDDFSRCYKLYKECGLTQSDLNKVSSVFPWWKPFIDNFEKLCDMYVRNDTPHEYIKALNEESRRLSGWKEVTVGGSKGWMRIKK